MQEVRNDTHIPETEREAIVLARRGQGRFLASTSASSIDLDFDPEPSALAASGMTKPSTRK